MSADLKPWHDTPQCRRLVAKPGTGAAGGCGGPLIPKVAADWNHRADSEDRLVCCSCGYGSVGTEAEVEQAERAQRAWEEEEERQRGVSSCAELCWADACRKAGRCDG